MHTCKGHLDAVGSLALSPCGRRLASWCRGEVKLWDVATAFEVVTLPGPTRWSQLCFDPSGGCLMATDRGKLRVWRSGSAGPEVIAPRPEALHAWHWRQALDAEVETNWFAVAFHVQRLLALTEPAQFLELLKEKGV